MLQRALRSLAGERESLPAFMLEQFPELRAIRVRRGGFLPRLGGWCLGQATVAGITVGRTVWIGRHVVPSAELLLHELRHVHQFESVRAFALRYVWETLRRGYHHNRFEVEARQFAVERTRLPREVPFTEGV